MQTLVTGGGGFLGLYLVEGLLRAGHQVRVLCRGQYAALEALGVETQQGDMRDAAAVSAACVGVDAVFHTAAVPGVWGPRSLYFGINTQGTENVLAACRQRGVSRLVYTSSPSVIFDGTDHVQGEETLPYPTRWLCHYPHSKALAEQAVLQAGQSGALRTVSLRPHLIWGPRDNHLTPRLIKAAGQGRLRQVGLGNNVVSVAYVENVAAAHLQAEAALRESDRISGRAYFINEPEAVNLWDWINLLLQRAGLPPLTGRISLRTAWCLGAVLETVWTLARLPGEPPMTRFVASQLAGSHSYSTAAAERDFGYRPIISMEEGLRRLQPELEALAAVAQA
jgi:nucleoside-diphosphate-sugar epimerase